MVCKHYISEKEYFIATNIRNFDFYSIFICKDFFLFKTFIQHMHSFIQSFFRDILLICIKAFLASILISLVFIVTLIITNFPFNPKHLTQQIYAW